MKCAFAFVAGIAAFGVTAALADSPEVAARLAACCEVLAACCKAGAGCC